MQCCCGSVTQSRLTVCKLMDYSPQDPLSMRFSWQEYRSEVAQSCPTLCDPMDCSLPGSSVPGILQARILEWVAISFSRGSSRPRDRTQVSRDGGRCFNLWATREAKSTCNSGDLSSIPGSGRSPGEGNGNPLQYSCMENPMDGGARWATKSWTWLSDFTFTFWLEQLGKEWGLTRVKTLKGKQVWRNRNVIKVHLRNIEFGGLQDV